MMVEKIDQGVTLGSKLAAAFIAGWIASSVWHQTAVTDKAAIVLPQVQAEAGCEHWRAGVASKLALGTSMVSPSQIPKDCPHPKVDVPRVEHPVSK